MGMAKPSSSARRPPGLQVLRSGAGGSTLVKPRIIHTHSPTVYKIKPEEFLDLVQKLTGRTDIGTSRVDSSTSTSPFLSQLQDNVDISSSSHLASEDYEADSALGDDLALGGTPVSTQLLASLPSPRLVTLNFLP
ncbi:hypothetical protein M758_5G156800 [Ceratodon purpureus]|nr:hypothetical protein M758_5G156800 [Ceratodon purpureus]